jgi:hypothetical protein
MSLYNRLTWTDIQEQMPGLVLSFIVQIPGIPI